MTDLRAVDELCRLVVVAQRLGCRVRLEGVSPQLHGLLDLAGVGDVVVDPDRNPQEPDLR